MRRASAGAVVIAFACAVGLVGCAAATPDPASITAAQRKTATQSDLDLRWADVSHGDPGYPRPKVAIVKYTNYLTEGPVLAACMHKAGYPHTKWSLADGLIDTDPKPVNRFPVEIAIYICEAKYPENPLELGYLSDAQEEYLYTYWSNETVPCMRTRGVTISNLPPIGEFGEGYEDVGELNPYDHILALPSRTPEALIESLCPPYPGELYAEHDRSSTP